MNKMRIRMESPVGAHTIFNGRIYDYFSGTGYLGLQNHPEVLQAAMNAIQQYGLSTATSRGGYGEHPIFDELESQACAFFDSEKVLHFASGYMGIAILTQATSNLFDHIFIDSCAHFSLWDAAQATNKPITAFHHCQAEHLAECLHRDLLADERPLVLSDGVFPVSGEIAPLPDYLALIKSYQGSIYLDDAHAMGVLGVNGRGTPDYFGIKKDESCHTCGTLSKALGGYGGVIWGDSQWVEAIDRKSGICAGASPPALPVTAASACALAIARANPSLRHQLWINVTHARNGLRDLGWEIDDTPVPIICLKARDDINLLRIKTRLFDQGIAITHVRSYTSTPAGGALRIAIFATHSPDQIDHLINSLGQLI